MTHPVPSDRTVHSPRPVFLAKFRKLNWQRLLRNGLRLLAVMVTLVALFVGIGLLPGRVEGVYAGPIFQCACDSFNFMEIRDGRLLVYSSDHPPADVFGRYESKSDGSVEFYITPLRSSEAEEVSFRATPHLWFTRFDGFDDGRAYWLWKRPRIGRVAKTIRDHPVTQVTIPNETTILTTYYDRSFSVIRTESKEIKNPRPKPAAADQP